MSKIAFLFPGQGAQFVGMGCALADSLPAARELFDRAAEVLGYDLAQLCFEGPQEQLNTTVVSQPALFVASLAALEQIQAESPQIVAACAATAGLSLGEYTAMTFAGVMDFETGLAIVRERGEAMQAASDATPSGMVSILGLSREQTEDLCDEARGQNEVLQIANLLCPGNIVVSGSKTACQRVAELARGAGALKAIPLAVAGAFHTPLMGTAVERLARALSDVQLHRPRIPVVCNVHAAPHDDPEMLRDVLIQQVVQPVRWDESMHWMLDHGCDQFYDVGPGRVLRSLLKRIDRKIRCDSVAA